MNAGVSAQTR